MAFDEELVEEFDTILLTDENAQKSQTRQKGNRKNNRRNV